MKTFTYAVVCFALGLISLSSCSKRLVSHSSDAHNRLLSQQLEMDYQLANDTASSLRVTEQTQVVNSAEGVLLVSTNKVDAIAYGKRYTKHFAMAASVKEVFSKEKKSIFSVKKPILNEKKVSEKQASLSPGVRTGIILGAIGLILIVVAGFFGAAAPIVYVGGAILFVVGLVMILIDIL
jgi:hypothetical protein